MQHDGRRGHVKMSWGSQVLAHQASADFLRHRTKGADYRGMALPERIGFRRAIQALEAQRDTLLEQLKRVPDAR